MSRESGTIINQLISKWPYGAVITTSALLSMGLSNGLINKCESSKWIKSIGRGAYALHHDRINWIGGIYALQVQLGLKWRLLQKQI
ncbi:MAG: AbiEi antitoxin N-terminal domain-containing protein [Spirochaetales bacterium]|nr:AbiEi antitoxin N-terminal domain-containing protein [Spirochaetales bacterium]